MTAVRIGLALAHALEAWPNHELASYWDVFLASLSEPVRKELEMQLEQHHRLPRSDWGRKIYDEGVAKGLADGRAAGLADGLAEGLAEGERRARATVWNEAELVGQVKGRASAIVSLLTLRGFAVGRDHRERISACTDLALLDQWLLRAATAGTIEDVFAA